jgi:hypothetical protein
VKRNQNSQRSKASNIVLCDLQPRRKTGPGGGWSPSVALKHANRWRLLQDDSLFHFTRFQYTEIRNPRIIRITCNKRVDKTP